MTDIKLIIKITKIAFEMQTKISHLDDPKSHATKMNFTFERQTSCLFKGFSNQKFTKRD